MPPLGIKPGQVMALVRELRVLETSSEYVAVAGPGARELAVRLAADGDASAVVVRGDFAGAAAGILLVDGPPAPTEVLALRRATRAGTPLLVWRKGSERVPYVLPGDVIDAVGDELPIEELAVAIARTAPDAAPRLAERLPALRPAAQRRLVGETAWGNALIAGAVGRTESDLPLLSLAQGRMLLLLDATRGVKLPRDPQALAAAVGPSLALSLGLGLVARETVRRLPARGRFVRGAVAYVATRALGEARLRLR